jgi:hypothetical protein
MTSNINIKQIKIRTSYGFILLKKKLNVWITTLTFKLIEKVINSKKNAVFFVIIQKDWILVYHITLDFNSYLIQSKRMFKKNIYISAYRYRIFVITLYEFSGNFNHKVNRFLWKTVQNIKWEKEKKKSIFIDYVNIVKYTNILIVTFITK